MKEFNWQKSGINDFLQLRKTFDAMPPEDRYLVFNSKTPLSALFELYSNNNTYVAKDGDNIAGVYGSGEFRTGQPLLSNLYIAPGYRGNGLGTSALRDMANRNGDYIIFSRIENDKARKLYEKFGTTDPNIYHFTTGDSYATNIPASAFSPKVSHWLLNLKTLLSAA